MGDTVIRSTWKGLQAELHACDVIQKLVWEEGGDGKEILHVRYWVSVLLVSEEKLSLSANITVMVLIISTVPSLTLKVTDVFSVVCCKYSPVLFYCREILSAMCSEAPSSNQEHSTVSDSTCCSCRHTKLIPGSYNFLKGPWVFRAAPMRASTGCHNNTSGRCELKAISENTPMWHRVSALI